jgi:predicted site-specific integrase-resolvase
LSAWVKNGRIKYTILPGGQYDYIDPNYVRIDMKLKRYNIIYSRVSTNSQRENLKRQTERLKIFCSSKGIIIDDVFEEIGSALNYNRLKYNKVIDSILDGKIENLIIESKDRFLRIGFEQLELICKKFNTNLIIVDNSLYSDKDKFKEIIEDMISIIHHYSRGLYSNIKRKKIEELLKQ